MLEILKLNYKFGYQMILYCYLTISLINHLLKLMSYGITDHLLNLLLLVRMDENIFLSGNKYFS